MTRFLRLLCLAALATTTAFAQNTDHSSLPYDPSLASDNQPALTQPDDAQPGNAYSKAAKPSASHSSTLHPKSAQLEAAVDTPDAAQPRLQYRPNADNAVLPTATVLYLKLVRPISTATARPGEQFFAILTRPVEVDGRTIVPSGTAVTCRIESTHPARRFASKPALDIKAFSVHLPSGEVLDFTASVIDTSNPHRLDVDEEGRVHGVTPTPMEKVELGSLAGAGLVVGAVVAGPEGLLIGTASGAALAAGHIIVKRRNLTLPAGTELIFELDAPATIAQPQMGS